MTTLCSFSSEEGSEGRTGEVLELTEAGFFLASNSLFPPGTSLALLLQLPNQRFPVRLAGEVAWARTTGRAGMYIRLLPAAEAPAPDRGATPPTDGAKKPRGPALSS